MKIYKWDSKKLELIKVGNKMTAALISLLFSLMFVIGFFSYKLGFKSGMSKKITENDVILLYHESEKSGFTRRKFYEYLKQINIKFPEIVFAQAMKECGFKSHLFKHNNNPFGMKQAGIRPNMQNGIQDGYAYYDTWKNAIVDYALYQTYSGLSKMKTKEEYLNYLKEMKYFDVDHPANVTYLSDLKKISDNIEDYLD